MITRQEHGHGAIITFVSLPALERSIADLERTRLDLARTRNRLMAIRERLDRVLEQIYRQRSSGPPGHPFHEETAPTTCGSLAANPAGAEERRCLLRAALAIERGPTASEPAPHRIH